jgi:hypothetical protein
MGVLGMVMGGGILMSLRRMEGEGEKVRVRSVYGFGDHGVLVVV